MKQSSFLESYAVSEAPRAGVPHVRRRTRAGGFIAWGAVVVLSVAVLLASATAAVAVPVVIGSPIVVGNQPWDVAINAVTNRGYVPNANDNSVSVINGATGRSVSA